MFPYDPAQLAQDIAAEPQWLQWWLNWMLAVNVLALVFVYKHKEARWVVAAFVAAIIIVNLVYAMNGYNKLLGLAHVIPWTPLIYYLYNRMPEMPSNTPFGVWIRVLFVTNFTSLVIDYLDVIRYILGERG